MSLFNNLAASFFEKYQYVFLKSLATLRKILLHAKTRLVYPPTE